MPQMLKQGVTEETKERVKFCFEWRKQWWNGLLARKMEGQLESGSWVVSR